MSLSLGKSIKQIRENQNFKTDIELKEQKEQKEMMEQVNWIKNLFSKIKTTTSKISNNQIKAVFDKKGRLIVCNTLIFGENDFFSYKFLHNGHDTNIITHFKKVGKNLPINNILDDFQSWMNENDINNVELTYEHDGFGISSWNDIRLTIK